jgi:hypothetical protein
MFHSSKYHASLIARTMENDVMLLLKRFCLAVALIAALGPVAAQDKPAVQYDAELAKSLGANDMGMRS